MDALIAFACPALLVYWIRRTRLLLSGSEERIDAAMEGDLWHARALWIAIRALFTLPSELA